jgi:hypothetical protein
VPRPRSSELRLWLTYLPCWRPVPGRTTEHRRNGKAVGCPAQTVREASSSPPGRNTGAVGALLPASGGVRPALPYHRPRGQAAGGGAPPWHSGDLIFIRDRTGVSGQHRLAVDLRLDAPLVTVGDRRGPVPCAPTVPRGETGRRSGTSRPGTDRPAGPRKDDSNLR